MRQICADCPCGKRQVATGKGHYTVECAGSASLIPMGHIIVIQNKICMHEYCLAYAQLEAGRRMWQAQRNGMARQGGAGRGRAIAMQKQLHTWRGKSLFLCERRQTTRWCIGKWIQWALNKKEIIVNSQAIEALCKFSPKSRAI